MTSAKHVLALCLAAAPAVALAAPPASLGTFHTTGGQTKLRMDVLSHDGATMKVRLSDPTKIAFNAARRSETLVLHRDRGGSPGWTAYASRETKGKDLVHVTIENAALAGKHGKVGMELNQWDPLLDGTKSYGYHFQLAGTLKK